MSSNLQPLLDELRTKHKVVGATLGVLQGGTIEMAASGLLNLETKVECTPDSVFQIGSIGKIFTTTLIMQLLDEGRLAIEDPVRGHLKDFAIADRDAARAITIRHLLNHTSGMDGDFFPPDDPEGASTASYLRKMALLPNLYPPGEGPVTYCNVGFVAAGRIIEILTGMTWQNAVMERIVRPLGLKQAYAHPHESLRFRCAMGHIADPADMTVSRVAPATFLSLSAAAAGSVLSMSVPSLLMFADAHMEDGRYNGGNRLLSASSAQRMRTDLTPVPPFTRAGLTHWGLGWMRCTGHGYEMAGHDGGTLGQFTYCRTFPEKGVAFALFTNSPSTKLYEDIEKELMQWLLGTAIPTDPPAQPFSPDFKRYTGRYENIAAQYDVAEKSGTLLLHSISKIGLGPEVRASLEPYCEDVFTIRAKDNPADGQKIVFCDDDKGRRKFARVGTRMLKRVAE
jgi:CubicO group peptidase (beta-lactamase class C family)